MAVAVLATMGTGPAWAAQRHGDTSNAGVTPGQVAAPTGPTAGSSSGSGGTLGHTLRTAAYANVGVLAFGDAPALGAPTDMSLNSPVQTMAASPDGKGYWLAASDGGVFSYGDAGYFGSAGGIDLYAPIVGMASTPDGKGYWMVALDGGVFSYGDAKFYGSAGSLPLASPIVGMVATKDGKGYWLAAADGGIFAYGDAAFYGSAGNLPLASAVVGMAATPDGAGYYLVGGDGGIFTYGDAAYDGSLGSIGVWTAGMAITPDGGGYWLVGADGRTFTFGDAGDYGNDDTPVDVAPISQIVATPDGKGYWMVDPDAFPTSYAHPGGGGAIVAAAASQVAGDPDHGYFCNPYGPCEAWCALFATWAWEAGGVGIPRYAFVGDIYTWAATHTRVTGKPAPGDIVLYGTGPQSTATAVHTGIVAQVWPDGAIDTIEGDSGPGLEGYYNVTMNGPYLPSHTMEYNGMAIFGFATP